jgi:hypothetical protein
LTNSRQVGAPAPSVAGNGGATQNIVSSFRTVAPHAATGEAMGPLKDLPGFWHGIGFNLIARPDFDPDNEDGFFLELNMLQESIEFTPIGSPVMNRGSVQDDIALFGVTYLHRVTDATTGGALHIEPGVWLSIPPTTDPPADASVARLATIPHGNAVCAFGPVEQVVPDGLPEIPPSNTVPFPIGSEPPPPGTKNPYKAYDLSADYKYRTHPLPERITQAMVDDPINLLRAALQGQTLTHITRLFAMTAPDGDGVANIPFIKRNAEAPELHSVWAIERVKRPRDVGSAAEEDSPDELLQLQYGQTALLNFRGMSFPHVSVGTLTKAF